jgi:hypothetical protein
VLGTVLVHFIQFYKVHTQIRMRLTAHVGRTLRETMHTILRSVKHTERDHLEDIGVDEKITTEYTKQGVML